MRRRTSPVQQWVDSLPSPVKSTTSTISSFSKQQSVSINSESASVIPECSVEEVYSEKENYLTHYNMTVSTPISVPHSPAITYPGVSRLARDPSFQSDSSHCSSVESLLELRRADPEAVLLSLGFGGGIASPRKSGPLSRIPKRFLQPSRLKGIAIDEFVRHQQEASESLDSTSLGYRGLTGSPYVAPTEIVQKIVERLREHESHEIDGSYGAMVATGAYGEPGYNGGLLPQQQEGRLSVLSPDNRQFLERPRSKSPDMRNKRMIIGQKSFAFGHDGNLIEVNPIRSAQSSQESSDEVFEYLGNRTPSKQTGIYSSSSNYSSTSSSSCSSPRKSKPNHVERSKRVSTETVVRARPSDRFNASNVNNNNNNNNNNNVASQLQTSANDHYERPGGSPRRASEGSCERSSRSSQLDAEEGRRFSDGVMHSMRESEAAVFSRRKSLRRQPKIRDSDEEDRPARPAATSRSAASEHQRCSLCGKAGLEDEDEGEKASCCYRSSSQSCWREMEKVLQKNKKLEDTVAKSRREMAEIRDMLSTVLSVRMEPGF